MSQNELVLHVDLHGAIDALKRDLLADGGPRISTIRSYNFAILPYPPEREFDLRRQIHGLSSELQEHGWAVKSIRLDALLLARIRAEGPEVAATWIANEKRLHAKAVRLTGNPAAPEPEAALATLTKNLSDLIDGPDGIAAQVTREIDAFCDANPGKDDRTVFFIGRAGALYPFFRTSALLRQLDGHTRNVPVVLLYPGARIDLIGLSFMGVLPPDRDYRPRIYP